MIRRLAAFARPFSAWLAASAALRVLHLALGIAILTVAARALAAGADAVATAGTIVVLAAAKGTAHYGEQYLGHRVAFTVLARLRTDFFDALARQAPGVLHRHRSGDLAARATADVNRVEVFYAHTIAPALAAVVVALGSAGYLAAAAHPALAVISLAGAAVSGLAVPLLGRRPVRQAARRRQETRGLIAAHVADTVGGLRDLALLGAAGRWERRLGALEERAAGDTRALAARLAIRRAANTAVLAATVSAVAVAGACLWRDGQLDRQSWWAAIAVTLAMAPALTAVEAFAGESGTTVAAARRIFEIIDVPRPRVPPPPAPAPPGPSGSAPPRPAPPARAATTGPATTTGPTIIGPTIIGPTVIGPTVTGAASPAAAERRAAAVSARGVGFAYPGSPPVLAGVDLDLPPGSTTAVLGATGSGKSSLGYLLAAVLTPTHGTITLDGADLRDLPEDLIRRRVALADQRPFVFSDTIAGNLRLADPGADEDLLWHVLETVDLAEAVRALPGRLRTRLAEHGADLSGGELQRLSLAQALLRRPALLICDEVTGQLDAATEARLLDRLRRDSAGRTTVWITHRPATLRAVDQVVVLDAGRVTTPAGPRLSRAGAARPGLSPAGSPGPASLGDTPGPRGPAG
ncbi:ABC transporter ATP-binding protein [Bailinhaonella thermotolerans]|uniref:ABC transporter ATP-binding protein n=1 Tax=Bailinhaonella thermotolerans TaxID=1070861 RepID=A0A3A4BV13_9ACTN|nr:ABC transporter ATP-binding protein [Bailinhaonella thermotolerans]RJL35428.1 ABC transporter ATP-binding protein [Bailinhaonella thermotolerans]